MSAKRHTVVAKGAKIGGVRPLPDMTKEQMFDLVTSWYDGSYDDEIVAQQVSGQYDVNWTEHMARTVRFEAAAEAERSGSPELRRKWVFRYQNLTVNNLIKEHMFLSDSHSFLEAKVEMCDELYWLKQKITKKDLLAGMNSALGRSDVTMDVIDELIEFRQTTLRVKQILAQHMKDQGVKINATRLLLDVSEKVVAAYDGECKRNKVDAAAYACNFLELPPNALLPTDIDFLREYSRASHLPDRKDKDSMSLLLAGSDSLQNRAMLDEAIRGRLPDMSSKEAQLLLQEVRTTAVPKRKHLEKMIRDLGPLCRRRVSGHRTFRSVRQIFIDYLRLTRMGELYNVFEILEMRILRYPLAEMQGVLDVLNILDSSDEVSAYLHIVIDQHPKSKRRFKKFGNRYFELRHDKPFRYRKRRQ